MTFKRTLALASLALAISTSALAAAPNSSISGKDASASTVTLGAVSDGTLKSPTHGIVDANGAIVSLGAYTPDSYTLQITAPTSSAVRSTVLGTGTTIAAYNSGLVPEFVAVGGSSVTATTGSWLIPPGNICYFNYAAGSAYVSGITTSGTGQLTLSSGIGGAQGCSPYTDVTTPATVQAGAISTGYAKVPQTEVTTPINISTATTTKLISNVSGKVTYITELDVIAGGTGNITFEYGTGTNCGTGTTVLSGPYNLTAQAGLVKGSGYGAVVVVPASQDFCALTSAAVQMSGALGSTAY